MVRPIFAWIALILCIVTVTLCCNHGFAAGVRIVPSDSLVTPGNDFYFDIVAEGVPPQGLAGAQFRVNVTPSSGTVVGVSDFGPAGLNDIAVVTPLLISQSVSGRSGIGDFFWSGKGANGILVMDNEVLTNGSALYTFAHTNGATPPSGSGSLARFAARIGSGVKAERLDITLSDVALLSGANSYPLDYATGTTIQLRCMGKVPSLTGLDRAAAESALNAVSLSLGSVYEIDNSNGSHPLNVVLEQSVSPGTNVPCQTPVSLAINTPPADVTNASSADKPHDDSGTVILTWTPSGSSDSAGYRIHAGNTLLKQVSGGTTGSEIGGLPNGMITSLKITAFDSLGNESSGVAVSALPLDDVPPVIAVSGILDGSIYRTDINPQVTVSDAGQVTWSAALNGSPFAMAPIAAEGSYTLVITATDGAGNTSSKSLSFAIDKTGPELTVIQLSGPVSKPFATLTGTVEASAGINITTTSAASVGTITFQAGGGWSCPVSDLVSGPNGFTVTAIDAAGNTTVRSVTVTYNAGLAMTVTPSSIAADRTVAPLLHLSNISPGGGEILVEQFVDANRNGVIDNGDYAVRSLLIKDGTGPADPGVPGDEDGTADGEARVTLASHLAGDIYHTPADYLFRASLGNSSALAPFSVTAVGKSQSISGTVTVEGNPVPGALVRLADTGGRHIAFAGADNVGGYTMEVAEPGDYLLTPMAYGFASPAPVPVSLTAGQRLVDKNLTLVRGDFHLTGRIKDEASGEGIPGVWVRAMGDSASGVVFSSVDGSYDLLLPAGHYTLSAGSDPSEPTPFDKGYPVFAGRMLSIQLAADSSGNDITLSRGTNFAGGRVLDPAGNGVTGVPVQARIAAEADSREPLVGRVSGPDGTFALPLIDGERWMVALDPAYAHLLNLIGTTIRDYSTISGPAGGNDITVYPVTARVRGVVKDSSGALLGGVEVTLRNDGSSITASTVTATNGTYSLGAFAGSWLVKAFTRNNPLPEQSVILAEGQTAVVDFVVDVTPPAFSIDPVVSPTAASSQTLTGTVEAGSTIVLTIDTTAFIEPVSYPTPTTWRCTVTGLAEGSNTITATATDSSANRTSASVVIVYSKPVGPDLIITKLDAPANAAPRQTITLSVTAGNQGTVKSGKFCVGIFLSADNVITTGDTFLGEECISSLAAGGNISYSTRVRIPANIAGNYYIGAIADTKRKIAESDEGNNTFAAGPIKIGNGPDLIITRVGAPATAISGKPITLPVTVKNKGFGTSGKFYVGIYLSQDDVITAEDILLGEEYVTSLAAGADFSYTTSVTIPKKANGTYYIGAIADTKGRIAESDEGNNTFATGPIKIANGPDLVITRVGAPATAISGKPIALPVTVKNQGIGSSGKFYVGIYLSRDNVITAEDRFMGEVYISSLAAAADFSFTTYVWIPWETTGTYYIGAIADTKGTIAESDEGNNSFSASPTKAKTPFPLILQLSWIIEQLLNNWEQ